MIRQNARFSSLPRSKKDADENMINVECKCKMLITEHLFNNLDLKELERELYIFW